MSRDIPLSRGCREFQQVMPILTYPSEMADSICVSALF